MINETLQRDLRTVGLERRGFKYHRTHALRNYVTECICDCQLCQAHYFQDYHDSNSVYPSLGDDRWLEYHYD